MFYLIIFNPLGFFLGGMNDRTIRSRPSPDTPDPINSSVRILALGVEGPNETTRLLTLGSRTVIAKKLFEHLHNHECRGHYGSMLERLGPDGSIIIIAANQSVATAILSISDIAVNGCKVKFVLGPSSNPALIRNRKGIVFIPSEEVTHLDDFVKEVQVDNRIEHVTLAFKNPSPSVIPLVCTFNQDVQFPLKISVWGARYTVKQFIPRAIQCFNCQGFGHMASNCRRGRRCLLCSGQHTHNECPQFKTIKQDQVLKCPNCSGNHAANARECPVFMEKKAIVTYSFTNNVPMRTAAEVLKKGLPTQTKHVPMAHKDSFPPLTPNHHPVEDLNKKYMTMFEGVTKQISYLAETITSLCKLVSQMMPANLQNAVLSLSNIAENLNRVESSPTTSNNPPQTSSPRAPERKRKGKEATPSPEGSSNKLQRPRLAPSHTND